MALFFMLTVINSYGILLIQLKKEVNMKVITTIALDPEIRVKLLRIASSENRSVSNLVETIIRTWLGER